MSELKRAFTAAAAFIGAVENSGKRVRVDELREAIEEQDAELLGQAVRLLLPYTVELSWPTVWSLIEACKAVDAFAELKENAEYWRQRVYEQFPSSFQYYFESAAPQQMKAKRLSALLEKLKYKPESNVFAGKAMPSAWYLLFQQCQRRLMQLKKQLAQLDAKNIGLITKFYGKNVMSMTVVTDKAIILSEDSREFHPGSYLNYDGAHLSKAPAHVHLLHPAFGAIVPETPNLSAFIDWLARRVYRTGLAGTTSGGAWKPATGRRYILPTQELLENLPGNSDFESLVHETSDLIGYADGALVNYSEDVFDIVASKVRRFRFAGVPEEHYIEAVLTSTPLVDLRYDSPFLVMVKNDNPFSSYAADLYNPNFKLAGYTCVNGWVSGTMPHGRRVVFNLYSYVKARDEGVAFQPFDVQTIGFMGDVVLDLNEKLTVVHMNNKSIGLTDLQNNVNELIACHTCSQVAELQCPRCVTPYCSEVCRQLDGLLHTAQCT